MRTTCRFGIYMKLPKHAVPAVAQMKLGFPSQKALTSSSTPGACHSLLTEDPPSSPASEESTREIRGGPSGTSQASHHAS